MSLYREQWRRDLKVQVMGEAWVLEQERRYAGREAAAPYYERIREVTDPARSAAFVARCGLASWERLCGMWPEGATVGLTHLAVAVPFGTVRVELAADLEPDGFEVVPR